MNTGHLVDRALVPADALALCATLESRGHRAWIVGGCIRDLLLGRAVADWDLCTTARPADLLAVFPRAIPTGIEHGTVTVMVNKVGYEVTTLRGETTYGDGRRPDAVFFVDDVTADLARRDFTVNALAWRPTDDRLVDPFDGAGDLARRVIRAVGNPMERFAEDGLRVLRAARFVATLEFEIEPATQSAMGPNIPTFRKVSAERVRDEWLKTMNARMPSRAFDLLQQTGVLGATHPAFDSMVGCRQNRHHEFDVWRHTMHALDGVPAGDPMLRMAALMHDIAKPSTREVHPDGEASFLAHDRVGAEMADELLGRLRFSNDDRTRITHLVRHHLVAYDDTWSDAAVRRFVQRVGTSLVPDLLALCRADSLAKGNALGDDLERLDRLRGRVDAVIAARSAMTTRDLAIDGNVIQHELGVPPSRRIGEILRALLDHVTEHPADNERATLLRLARVMVGAGP